MFQPQIITRSSLSFETAPPNKHAPCVGPKNEQNYYYIAVSVWLSIARAMGLPWLVCGFDSVPVENLASSHWRWSFQGWKYHPFLFETTNQLVLSTNKTLSTFQNQWPSDTSTNGMSRVFPKLRHIQIIQIIQIILLVIYNHRKNSIIQCFPMKHITFLSPFYPHHVPIEYPCHGMWRPWNQYEKQGQHNSPEKFPAFGACGRQDFCKSHEEALEVGQRVMIYCTG